MINTNSNKMTGHDNDPAVTQIPQSPSLPRQRISGAMLRCGTYNKDDIAPSIPQRSVQIIVICINYKIITMSRQE